MDHPDPAADPQICETDTEDEVEDSVDDVQQRLWLKATTASAQALAALTMEDRRVQYAVDQAIIAACERINRLCRSDLVE